MSEVLLDVRGIVRRFGGVTALDGVSFSLAEGEILGLIGPNGAGKTTLINVISGFEPADAGSVVFGQAAGGPWLVERAVSMGLTRTFQTPRVFSGLPVRRNLDVALASSAAGRIGKAAKARTDDVVELFGLAPWLTHEARDLPYGVLRNLSIALAVITAPRLLMLDEPCVGLDAGQVRKLQDMLRTLVEQGVTLMVVEHNMSFVMKTCSRICVLERGSLLFEGSPAECAQDQRVRDAYLGGKP